MKLVIKNMVCNRCKIIVQSICDELNLTITSIQLGQITLAQVITLEQKTALKNALAKTGLQLLDDARHELIEQIKQACLSYLNNQPTLAEQPLSKYISAQVNKEYNYLSRFFSSVESTSVEQYFIALRVEKIKELITYEQLSFSEIAHNLGFSSVAHLSRQFKKVTGLTLSDFRSNNDTNNRQALDKVKNLQQKT